MRGLRRVQRGAQRLEKDTEIRSYLAQWDEEYPFLPVELIVRYAAGLLASSVALTVYDLFRGSNRKRPYHY